MDHGGETKDHLKAKTVASHDKRVSFAPLILHENSDNGNESRTGSEDADSASTSSSNSSSDDFIQVIPHKAPKTCISNPIPRSNGSTTPLNTKNKVDVPNEPFYMLEETNNESPESILQSSDITHESLMAHKSPTQLPPVQVMERPLGFDPGRISASIFSSPLSPTEWSAASNESLFSIHIGNNSFRGASRRIKDFYRSGELPKSGELLISNQIFQSEEPYKSSDQTRTDEFNVGGQTSLVAEKVQPCKHIDMTKNLKEVVKPKSQGVEDAPINKFLVAPIDQNVKNIKDHDEFISVTQFEEGKGTVSPSVTFPTKKSTCPSCHCSSCCHMFCFCNGASCSYKCPSCCCKWSDFHCKWWSGCSCKWFNFRDCCNNVLSCPSCCCKWSRCCCSCPSCQWSSCHRSCQWSSCCRSCQWSSCCTSCQFSPCCRSFHLKSCWPGCNCKCPLWPNCHFKCSMFKCFSWPSLCCKCPSWTCFKCHCPDFSWLCCHCWKHKPKR